MVRIHADAYDSVDFFSDESLLPNPYPYFDHLRSKSPVLRLPPHQVMAITGYPEGAAVYRDSGNFSSLVAVGGPFPPLPFEPRGDDIGEQIERHRHRMPMSNYLTTMDPPRHPGRGRCSVGCSPPSVSPVQRSRCGASPVSSSTNSSPPAAASSCPNMQSPSRSG
ncbi:hypothetical protein NIIDMKKI_62640 [Mycobacterium kansasii]|uniref:Uncharacterized protein n=1 Tax=Mycobacterium kansasii TaxID=1768 RepID=A0A1V3WK22_MYCKA|nr:hypothetical protein I547_1416 [Mycobacterium kansasii 824]OOK67334.1 hypothetical protein BZL30_7945 [Mycobacterium kansasii]BCI91058.1 hypothetical protein NIIDMKKI_62640 [Mycobacterium kansasii]